MSALSLMVVITLASLSVLVLGVHILTGAIRFLIWIISTKAGWITAGFLVLVYVVIRYG